MGDNVDRAFMITDTAYAKYLDKQLQLVRQKL